MKSRALIVAAFAVFGLLRPETSRAQPHPMPPDPYDTHQQQAPATTPAANTAQPAPQVPLPAPNDYPAAEVQAVPGAHAQLVLARSEFNRAESNLSTVI